VYTKKIHIFGIYFYITTNNLCVKVKNLRATIMDQLDTALAQHAPPPIPDDPTLYELPPLILDGIPTPVEKMTQAQLRAFIPLMLKYSTGKIYFI